MHGLAALVEEARIDLSHNLYHVRKHDREQLHEVSQAPSHTPNLVT